MRSKCAMSAGGSDPIFSLYCNSVEMPIERKV